MKLFRRHRCEPCRRSHVNPLDTNALASAFLGITVIESAALPAHTMMVSKDVAEGLKSTSDSGKAP